MNRKRRRAEKSKMGRCRSCGQHHPFQTKSEFDGKMRCPTCHELHLKHVTDISGDTDKATSMRAVKAQQVQEALHKAVLSVFPGRNDLDAPLVIWQLGLLAATFAVTARVSRREFAEKMELYMSQVQEMLGEKDDEQPDEPLIVLPD